MGWISVSGRFPGGGHGDPLQYSCLESPMDRGVRWTTAHGVAESSTTEATSHNMHSIKAAEAVLKREVELCSSFIYKIHVG